MPNLREIRRRIGSVKNTRQITKAMELVAASKMKRAQQNASAGQPYAALLAEMLSHIGTRIEDVDTSVFEQREIKTRGIILITTNRGLCGPLNSNLFREVLQIKEDAKFVSVGRKGKQFLGRSKRDLIADFEIDDKVSYLKVKQVVDFMKEQYETGAVDTIEVLYPRFVNTLIQEASFAKLFPIVDLEGMINSLRGKGAEEFKPLDDERKFKFEPDVSTILEELLFLFVNREAHQAVMSAKAAEHSSRMVAMKTAKDNASKLIDSLTLQYNKARQAAITQEILEIAAATASNR